MTHRATDLPWDGDTSRALPTTTYHDDAFFRAEVRTIWHGDWVFVATEADLPDPGDRTSRASLSRFHKLFCGL